MPTVRPKSDTTRAIQRYKDNTANAGTHWQDGVKNPRRSAKAEALKANATFKASMQSALQNDSWAKGISAIDEAQIDATVDALGPGVYTAGVAAKMPKAEKALARELPITQAVADEVRSLPGTTPEERAERAKQFALRRGKKKA